MADDDTKPTDSEPIDTGLRFNLLPYHRNVLHDLADEDEDVQALAIPDLMDIVHGLYRANVYESGPLPPCYRQMYHQVEAEVGVVQARQALHENLGNRLNQRYVAAHEADLDPDRCLHVKERGEQCGNDRPEGGDYCHAHRDEHE